MNEDSGIVKWIFNTTTANSVEFRSTDIEIPNLEDDRLINMGFAYYKKVCESCHGVPGKEETELIKGLNPPPPKLTKIARALSPEKILGVTKNGES